MPTAAITSPQVKIAAEKAEIQSRLQTLTPVLNGAAAQIKAVTPKK